MSERSELISLCVRPRCCSGYIVPNCSLYGEASRPTSRVTRREQEASKSSLIMKRFCLLSHFERMARGALRRAHKVGGSISRSWTHYLIHPSEVSNLYQTGLRLVWKDKQLTRQEATASHCRGQICIRSPQTELKLKTNPRALFFFLFNFL
ncbi:hypothetical protein KIN20_038450 [Parelaphostrongylus tenuis]|uniref:Uncharacterized protein n=1 Tax=Parelaphostrongylus tenuis TaxID=148309 RepID=A0AAD5R5U8_PARTN|nr:hypothetical protein KIN20_038450 [Parelaphostrongylus tenuis]